MPEPQRLRLHDLQRRARDLGTTVLHVVRLDADLERQALASVVPEGTKDDQHAD
jgi:hypothetical protein